MGIKQEALLSMEEAVAMKRQWRRLYFAVGLLFVAIRPSLACEVEDMPTPLIKAAAAYKAKGAGEFLPTLIKGSRLRNTDNASLSQANSMLREIEAHYGSYLGVELIGSMSISDSTRIVYFVLSYEHGPLYGVADIYKTPYGEIVTNSRVNTELNQIVPMEVLAKVR